MSEEGELGQGGAQAPRCPHQPRAGGQSLALDTVGAGGCCRLSECKGRHGVHSWEGVVGRRGENWPDLTR